jgi:hypothetical protein
MIHEEARSDPLEFHRWLQSTELQAHTLAYQVAGVASDEGVKFWKIIDGPSPRRKLGCKRVNGASSRRKLGCKRVGGALSR